MAHSTLLNLHIAACFIHLVSCILSWYLHTDSVRSDITIPHHVYEINNGTMVKSTIYESVMKQSALAWITANEALTFFSHLIAVAYLGCYKDEGIKFEPVRRTMEYLLTAGILQVALVLGVGSMSLYGLLFLLIANLVLQTIGYAIDRSDSKGLLYTAAFVLLGVQILYVLANGSYLSGPDTTWYTAMNVIYAVFYVGFGIVKFIDKRQNEVYILMSVTSKISLSWLLIGNIFQSFRDLGAKTDPDFTDFDWRAFQVVTAAVTGVGLVLGFVLLMRMTDEGGKKVSASKEETDTLMETSSVPPRKPLRY